MFTDTRIIQRHAAYEVLAHHVAITWPDQSTVALHAVRAHGYDDMFLRALRCDALHWIVFDLRDVARTLATDIKALPRRDTDGLVLHTLRLAYDDATEFRHRAAARFRAGWLVPREPAPRPALAGVAA
jgi:hypothetical protein